MKIKIKHQASTYPSTHTYTHTERRETYANLRNNPDEIGYNISNKITMSRLIYPITRIGYTRFAALGAMT